ncbi:MAG: 50S ribosomal protein L25/general stress protein Ctc [Alphaproteobacteria bacterium]
MKNLKVSLRGKEGKGASRLIRKEGFLPAIIYGEKESPTSIKLEKKTLVKEMHENGFYARLFNLTLDKEEQKVLCKKVDFDSVSGAPIHADFLRVGKKPVKVKVALEFTDRLKSKGLKEGGILNILRRKLILSCKPEFIPSSIEISLAGLEFGDGIHVEDLKLPEGTELADEGTNFSLVTIVAPRKIEEEVKPTEEGEEAEGDADADGEKTEETDKESEVKPTQENK